MPVAKLALPALMVVFLAACGPSGMDQARTGDPLGLNPTPVAIGQTMTANHHGVRVLSFHRGPSTRSGKECVQVSVSLTNTDTTGWTTPLAQMRLLDSRAFVYYPSDACGTSTNLQTLDPGQSASATLYFEVLANAVVDFGWTPNASNQSFAYSTTLK